MNADDRQSPGSGGGPTSASMSSQSPNSPSKPLSGGSSAYSGNQYSGGQASQSFGQGVRSSADDLKNQVGDAIERGRAGIADSAYAARENMNEDMSKLREDVARLTETLSKFASEAGGEAAKTARSIGSSVASQVSSAASSMAETGAEMASAAGERAKTFASELEGMARRQPLGALAGALFVGILIGMMSRGRG